MNFSPEAEQNLFQKRNLPSYICWIILLVDLLQSTEQFLPLKLNLVEVLKSKYRHQKKFEEFFLFILLGFEVFGSMFYEVRVYVWCSVL